MALHIRPPVSYFRNITSRLAVASCCWWKGARAARISTLHWWWLTSPVLPQSAQRSPCTPSLSSDTPSVYGHRWLLQQSQQRRGPHPDRTPGTLPVAMPYGARRRLTHRPEVIPPIRPSDWTRSLLVCCMFQRPSTQHNTHVATICYTAAHCTWRAGPSVSSPPRCPSVHNQIPQVPFSSR